MATPFLLCMTLSAVAVIATTCPALAQAEAAPNSNAEEQGKQFELKATMSDRLQLSRKEVDPNAVGATRSIAIRQRQQNVEQPPAIAAKPETEPLLPPVTDPTMIEYNVDWSTWIGKMADRWFYQLRSAEYQMGVQFHTPRPALIQFTCYADGTIGNITLRQSSGVNAYDRLQVETLLQISPLPSFPKGTHRSNLTLVQGWESHPKQAGEEDYQPGSFGRGFPQEKVRKWVAGR